MSHINPIKITYKTNSRQTLWQASWKLGGSNNSKARIEDYGLARTVDAWARVVGSTLGVKQMRNEFCCTRTLVYCFGRSRFKDFENFLVDGGGGSGFRWRTWSELHKRCKYGSMWGPLRSWGRGMFASGELWRMSTGNWVRLLVNLLIRLQAYDML